MKYKLCLPVLLLLGLLVSRCSLVEPEAEREPIPPRELTLAEKQITDAGSQFGLTLFRALSEDAPNENLFLSPLSVSMALGMTLNGAGGETYTAMQQTLELAGLSQESINQSYQSLIELLVGLDPKVAFEIANSIWYRQGFAVEPDFLDGNTTYFDAEVRDLDFGHPDAVDIINGWVSDKTHGKIEQILQEIDPATVMFLINAIYFKGTWTYEFDKDETREDVFTRHDGTTADVPMMRQEADLPYFETESFQAVDLPYGDSLFSMTILLPREGYDIDALAAELDEAHWNDWVGRFETRGLDLRLPRFKLEYEKELNEVLTALGMGIAFDAGRADFTGINRGGGLWIDYVKHKAFVEVNEEGTEAAAVTVVAINQCAGCGGGTPISMHVNRPFIFTIREQHSGTILFIGKVNVL